MTPIRRRPAIPLRSCVAALVALASFAAGHRPVAAQEPGSIVGRVLDAETGEPIAGVEVAVAARDQVATNASGGFLLRSVRVGSVTLTFRHVAYGEHSTTVEVSAGGERAIQVLLSPQAIELEPFEVEVESTLETRRNTSGHGVNEITRAEIVSAARAGMTLTDLLQTMPGAIASRTSGTQTCVVYRPTGLGGDSNCRAVDVVLDGVLLSNPGTLYDMIPLDDIERIEMMSPGQAGLRYSTSSGQAVLLVETRTGTRAPTADTRRYVTGLHWSEAGTHPTRSVFLSTLLANTLLVGASLLAGEACFSAPDAAAYDLRTECGGGVAAAVGVFSVAGPALIGARVGRRAGETTRTRGRTTPAAVAAAIVLTSAYALVIRGGDTSRTVGLVLLGAGVPLTLTFSDRIFRELR